jgi:hypothetical protein
MKFQQSDGGCTDQMERENSIDCTVRALAIAGHMDYDTAWVLMADSGRKACGTGSMQHGLHKAREQGYIQFEQISWLDISTLAQFAKQNPRGRYIVRIRGGHRRTHVFALLDGVIYDTRPWHGRMNIKAAWKIQNNEKS